MIPTRDAKTPPIGTPDIINVETTDRLRVPTYSAASAFALGTNPPRPTPPMNRSRPKVSGFGASAQRAVNTENHAVQARIVRRRPKRSANVPAHTAPTSIP